MKKEYDFLICYGVGKCGSDAYDLYKSKIAYYCDSYKTGKFKGIDIISFNDLLAVYSDYTVMVTLYDLDAAFEVCQLLKRNSIPYVIFDEMQLCNGCLHVYGTYPQIKYDCDWENNAPVDRFNKTITRLRTLFEKDTFPEDSIIDFWIYCWDYISDAWKITEILQIDKIFAYYTMHAFKEKVIPFPDIQSDYMFRTTGAKYELLKDRAKEVYKDSRVFWIGSTAFNVGRQCLLKMGGQYPNILHIIDLPYDKWSKDENKKKEFVPIEEQAKYKYLIDVRGYGWTDRLKNLLQCGRVVFIADRPYKEWYFDRLIPNEHYVPIKEDLSDLIEKYRYLEDNPQYYKKIADNMRLLADSIFSPMAVTQYTKEIVMKYGIVKQ